MNRLQRMLAGRDDSGFSLIELMVASFVASILLFAALNVLDSSTRTEKGQQVRHDAMLEIRRAMGIFTKDLRQATWIDPESTQELLKMKTLMSGAETDVEYRLHALGGDLYELRRKVGIGAEYALVTNMVVGTTPFGDPDPPFCYSYYSAGAPSECVDTIDPNTGDAHPPDELTAIRITLAKDPEFNPGEPITLATDVELRNL
jgi:prepilin-type N-terminal cleavage/methylation domain-containing protein